MKSDSECINNEKSPKWDGAGLEHVVCKICKAVKNGDMSGVRELLETYNDSTSLRNKCMWFAAQYGKVDVVKFLIQNGADVNAVDKRKHTFDRTGLLLALERGHFDVAKLLIQSGADVNIVDGYEKKSPLHVAAKVGRINVVKVLIQNGAQVNYGDKDNYTALHRAVRNGYVDVAKLLILNGADVNLAESLGRWTALHFACDKGHLEIVKILIENGAKVNMLTKIHGDALMRACSSCVSVDVVKYLISHGSNVNRATKWGWTPLRYLSSVSNKYDDNRLIVCNMLISNGANVNVNADSTMHGANTPLYEACSIGLVFIAKLLIQNGAHVNAQNMWGTTPLITAALQGHFEILKLLIRNGADVNMLNNNKSSALDLTAAAGRRVESCRNCVLYLVCCGAEINELALRNDQSDVLRVVKEWTNAMKSGKPISKDLCRKHLSPAEQHYLFELAFTFAVRCGIVACRVFCTVRSYITFRGLFMSYDFKCGYDNIWDGPDLNHSLFNDTDW